MPFNSIALHKPCVAALKLVFYAKFVFELVKIAIFAHFKRVALVLHIFHPHSAAPTIRALVQLDFWLALSKSKAHKH